MAGGRWLGVVVWWVVSCERQVVDGWKVAGGGGAVVGDAAYLATKAQNPANPALSVLYNTFFKGQIQ